MQADHSGNGNDNRHGHSKQPRQFRRSNKLSQTFGQIIGTQAVVFGVRYPSGEVIRAQAFITREADAQRYIEAQITNGHPLQMDRRTTRACEYVVAQLRNQGVPVTAALSPYAVPGKDMTAPDGGNARPRACAASKTASEQG